MVSMIVTMDEEGGISREGHVPWTFQEIRSSRNLFEQMTSKSIILMGRNGFRIIPGRTNVLIDDNAVERLHEYWNKEGRIWVTGGISVYKQLLDHCTFLYITHIEGTHNCDTFFPPEYKDKFKQFYSSTYESLKRSVWVYIK